MSDNQLTTFDVAAFPCVERLYLTRNRLAGAAFHGRGRELRSLSVLKIDQQANGGRELYVEGVQLEVTFVTFTCLQPTQNH